MKIVPLTADTIDIYLEVGIASYCEHYLHLWKNSDPREYMADNFTEAIVSKDLLDPNLKHFIVKLNEVPVGLLKMVKDSPLGNYTATEAILLEKIYLLADYSGQGIGKECLTYAVDYAKTLNKKILWLDTMKKGRALSFYLDFGFRIVRETSLSFPSAVEEQKGMYILSYEL